MHCLTAYITRKECFKGYEDTIPNVKGPQDSIIFILEEDKQQLEGINAYVKISTDYFGGPGEQSAEFIRDGKIVVISDDGNAIDKCLKAFGVICESNQDEFDTIGLDNYRTSSDIVDEWEKSKKTIADVHDNLEDQPILSDEKIIELAKENCMMHRTSDELGFLVMFDLNDLRKYSTQLLKNNK